MGAEAPKNTDDVKGRAKEAAGNLTGDEELQQEGKVDRAVGRVKDAVDSVAAKVKDLTDRDR